MVLPARPPKRTAASPATLARLKTLLLQGPRSIDDLADDFVDSTVMYQSQESLEAVMWSYPDQFRLDRHDRWYRVDLGPELDLPIQHCCPRGQALGVPVCADCSPTQIHR